MLPKDTEHFSTRAVLPMKRFALRLKQPLKNEVNSCPWFRNGSLGFSKSKRTETDNVCVKGGLGSPAEAETFFMRTEF